MGAEHAGDPVVLLHGLFGAASNFGSVQRRLATDHRVLALDLRNHGRSPHAPGMSYPAMAADVIETLDARGIGPAAVIGHSMGGKVAMQLALLKPERVRRLMAADIAPVRYEPHFRAYTAAILALPLPPDLTRGAADAALAPDIPDKTVRGFLLQNLRFGPEPSWRNGLREISDALPDIEGWEGTGQYAGPVVSLQGERSDYVLTEHRPLFRALFPAVRFLTLRNAGHWLHADAPEPFMVAVQAFLRPEA